jgi:thiosulfate dehydrogenase
VGVAAVYPKYRSRQNYSVDLVTRTNDCFTRSQNGKALPPDSKEMVSILTYYKWISTGVPIYDSVPWLGAGKVEGVKTPDKNNGQQVYASRCGVCHGADGMGTNIAPPLWGDGSYNDGAGMSKPETLTSFAFYNMPRGNPTLSPEEAADVALYVDSQPRPHYGD